MESDKMNKLKEIDDKLIELNNRMERIEQEFSNGNIPVLNRNMDKIISVFNKLKKELKGL